MLDVAGQDATEAFEDVGHSDEAREILEGLLVGTLQRAVRLLSPKITALYNLTNLFAPIARRSQTESCLPFDSNVFVDQ